MSETHFFVRKERCLAAPDLLFLFFEHVFAYAAERADPIFREIFESDVVVFRRIVDITADCAYIFHDRFLLLLLS